MARSLCGAATLTASLADSFTLLVKGRGYAAVAAATGSRGAASAAAAEEKTAVVRKVAEYPSGAASANSSAYNPWIPDPVTGYYRPANRGVEVDAAEMRETLLSRKH